MFSNPIFLLNVYAQMEPEQQKEHPKDDVEEMDTEHGGDTAPTADSDESKVTPKERSKAWKNFKRTEDGNKAKCNHCGQLVTIRSPSGVNTSTMLKHMLRCKKLHPELEVETVAGKRVKQSTLMHQPKKDKDDEAVPSYLQYDKDECRKGLVRMIIKDELPFRVVEKEGFREFMCSSASVSNPFP